MGRILRFFTRGKRTEDKVDSLRKAQRTGFKELNERLDKIESKLEAISGKLPESAQFPQPEISAKKLLNEYLYGENGDE